MRLFLCEKPSQGRDIAKILGARRRGDGYPIGPETTVTWCIGHLLGTAPPEAYGDQYKPWSLEYLPIILTQWQVKNFKGFRTRPGNRPEFSPASDRNEIPFFKKLTYHIPLGTTTSQRSHLFKSLNCSSPSSANRTMTAATSH